MNTLLRTVLKSALPERIRQALRQAHQSYQFGKAIRRFVCDPLSCAADDQVLSQLDYGWGNTDFSAGTAFLKEALAQAIKGKGNILECGSGLSTLLLGAAAAKTGGHVYSLEHHPGWANRVRQALDQYGITNVTLLTAPLISQGEFDWYDVAALSLEVNYQLVICDGPPGETRGGRYGMLPVMGSRLAPGCLILLDDAWRIDEQQIAARWAREGSMSIEQSQGAKPFIRLK